MTTDNRPSFSPASRRAVKLKIAVQGPSGSGKTLGALALAYGLAQGERIAVIDTENGSASLYADRYQFDTLEIGPPYLTKKYQEAVQAAIDGGYGALVIDSISHQWDGDGGILQRKEEKDARGGNHFSNWEPFTKEHNAFRSLILSSQLHIVVTMRSKMAYAQESAGSKTEIKKLGLQPIQREGMEYEFAVAFDVQMDHRAAASKDRTGLFTEGLANLLDSSVPQRLLHWLQTAAPAAAVVADAPKDEAPALPVDEPVPDAKTPFPHRSPVYGKPITEWPHNLLLWACEPGRKLGLQTEVWQQLAREEVKRRSVEKAAS